MNPSQALKTEQIAKDLKTMKVNKYEQQTMTIGGICSRTSEGSVPREEGLN